MDSAERYADFINSHPSLRCKPTVWPFMITHRPTTEPLWRILSQKLKTTVKTMRQNTRHRQTVQVIYAFLLH